MKALQINNRAGLNIVHIINRQKEKKKQMHTLVYFLCIELDFIEFT